MDGGAAVKNLLTFDEAWPILQEEVINKLIDSFELEGLPNYQCFTSQDYMRFYTIVYNVCSPNQLSPEVKKMYDQYKQTFEDYISSQVLPSLRGKADVNLLTELLRRWNNHKILTRWLSRFFHYISRYYIPLKKLPSLEEMSHSTFYNLVYGEIKDQVNDAIISMINREREGEEIDQAMVKEVVHIYDEIGEDKLKHYAEDFEEAIIEGTSKFYSRKALNWIPTMSYDDYMLKVEECLQQEKNRVSDYLRLRSKHKVLEVVQHELLKVHASKLEEKKLLHDAAAQIDV